MENYLKIFDNSEEYDSATYLEKPKVAHFVTEIEVKAKEEYLTFVAIQDSQFKLDGNPLNYSLDGGQTWEELPLDTYSPVVRSGEKIMFKGECAPTGSSYSIRGIGTFSSTGKFKAVGSAMSLLYGDNFESSKNNYIRDDAFYQLFKNNTNLISSKELLLPVTELGSRCYFSMFYGCENMVDAPKLPATYVPSSAYCFMFENCVSLKETPELPATSFGMYCYCAMFRGCSSITKAPKLPATEINSSCYSSMFTRCTSLTHPPELPATTAYPSCYYSMFEGCTSLTEAPKLPATTLWQYCYQCMFKDCTNLTEAPELPATELYSYCYSHMFANCKKLTRAPKLPALELTNKCYRFMFSGCTRLNYIEAMFTTTPDVSTTEGWVSGVASNGTFVKNSAAQWNVTGTNGVPTNWTIETKDT